MRVFSRPYIAHQRTEVAVAVALVVLGFVLLHDAYDGRGLRPPWFFGPFKPW